MKFLILFILLGTACCAYCDRPLEEMPEFGGSLPGKMQIPDAEASRGAAEQAWRFFFQGNLNDAIRKFNEAWLADRNNFQAYWGFGVICSRRADGDEDKDRNLRASLRYMTKALTLAPKNDKVMTDLGVSHLVYGQYLKANRDPGAEPQWREANRLFQKACTINPYYPMLYQNWAYVLFLLGDYPKAKEKAEKAKELGIHFPEKFTGELEKKLK